MSVKNFWVAGMTSVLAMIASGNALAGPTPQWNALFIGSIVDGENLGSEAVSIVPIVGLGVESGCTYADLYIIRDPAIIHGTLALASMAMTLGWQVQVLTSGACDVTGRPLVISLQVYSATPAN